MGPFSVIELFRHLRDTPNSYAGQGGKGIRVKDDESGLEFGTSGGFDPDEPLDYFTMVDADGDAWVAEMGTDGAWITTADTALTTEAGDVLTTEDDAVLAQE